MEPTDVELVRRARRGDEQALTLLIGRHAPQLHQMAVMMTGSTHDAQDIVQETLLAIWQQLHRFEERSTFRTWAIGILLRQTARHRRRQAARRMVSWFKLGLTGDGTDEATGEPTATENAVQRSDAKMDVMRMLEGLPTEQREVLVLREMEGLSYAEMAAVLRLPRGTVESRLHRARLALRERWEQLSN